MTEQHSHEYLMGYDCGLNGPNTTNCSFKLFSTPEKTKQWELGKKVGELRKKLIIQQNRKP
jgi:hypothetical protein